MSTLDHLHLRRITLAMVVAAALGACSSNDGRNLPLPREDQFETIVTTTSTIAPAAEVGGVAEPVLPAEAATTLPPAAAPTVPITTVAVSSEPSATAAPAGVATISMGLPWAVDGPIPVRHTCRGAEERDVAPAVQWAQIPAEAVEIAVVMTDPAAGEFVHWIVVGLDPNSTGIPEAALPAGASNELNSSGTAVYFGPCPNDPVTRSYVVEVLALSQQFESTGAPAAETVAALRSLAIGSMTQAGLFPAA